MKNCFNGDVSIFTGNSNPALAQGICEQLDIPLGKAEVSTFSDGEIQVDIKENVRGRRVFVIQSTCPPVNNNLMELLLMVDALKRASATEICAVVPYYGYGRQDRKVASRSPISAKAVADLMSTVGTTRVLCVDLHAGQIQGFFNMPVDNLFARPVLIQYLQELFSDKNLVVVSPDSGGVERARAFAKRLDAKLAVIDKRRDEPNQSKVMNVVGDVEGLIALLLDDLVDTAGTIKNGAKALKERGAKEVFACATHPVLSGKAIENLTSSPIKTTIVTDTIPLSEKALESGHFRVCSMDSMIADAIKRIYKNESISRLFI